MTPDHDILREAGHTTASRATHAPGDSARILIVDDCAAVRSFVERVLRRAGYTTMTAADGPEALDVVARAGLVDLLFTDVVMSQMDGAELAQRLRQFDPDLKVLYFTGHGDRFVREKGTLSNNEALLEKPSTINGLLSAVSALLHSGATLTASSHAGPHQQ